MVNLQNQVSDYILYGDPKAAGILAESNPLTAKYLVGICGLARKLAYRYGQENNEDDFIQVALATACKYEARYVEDTATFYTYCSKPITTAIQEEFGNPNTKTKIYKTIQRAIKQHQDDTGSYPDLQDLQELTKLRLSDIIGIYYDKYRDVSLQSLGDDIDMTNFFDEDKTAWIDEHFGILTEQELLLIDSVYYREQDLATLSSTLGVSLKKLEEVHKSALEKLKLSIGDTWNQ